MWYVNVLNKVEWDQNDGVCILIKALFTSLEVGDLNQVYRPLFKIEKKSSRTISIDFMFRMKDIRIYCKHKWVMTSLPTSGKFYK